MTDSVVGWYSNPIIVSLVSIIVGGIITVVITRFMGRIGKFRYTVVSTPLALSADDAVFGAITVAWRGSPIDNVYTVVIEIKNTSSTDHKNVELRTWTGTSTIILSERTNVVDTTYFVSWSPAFKESMTVPPGDQVTKLQQDIYNHQRDYLIEVFNRGQTARFTYLCTCMDANVEPFVELETNTKGVKLKYYHTPTTPTTVIMGAPIRSALWSGLYCGMTVVILCCLFLTSTWLIGTIGLVMGLTSMIWGALVYKFGNWIKNLFTS